jgi:hypothetical protein
MEFHLQLLLLLLSRLFSHCIVDFIWPTPNCNKEEPTRKTNDRSIYLLSVIPKLFEKVRSVTPGVFSCFLWKLAEDWRSDLDVKKDIAVVAIDLSIMHSILIFIPHNLLLAKLKSYGLDRSIDLLWPWFVPTCMVVNKGLTGAPVVPYFCERCELSGNLLSPSSLCATTIERFRFDFHYRYLSVSLAKYASDWIIGYTKRI